MSLKENSKKKQSEAVMNLIMSDIENYFKDSLESCDKMSKLSALEVVSFKQKMVNKWKSIENIQNCFTKFLEKEENKMLKYFIDNYSSLLQSTLEYKKNNAKEIDDEYIKKLSSFVLQVYQQDEIKYYKRAFLFFYLT
jgi:DUF438 domain-containing protein